MIIRKVECRDRVGDWQITNKFLTRPLADARSSNVQREVGRFERLYRQQRHVTRDALLTTQTPAETQANAERVHALTGLDLGRVWNGIDRGAFSTADARRAADALRRAADELERYAGAEATSAFAVQPDGSAATNTAAVPQAASDAARRRTTRDAAHLGVEGARTLGAIAGMKAAAASYWAHLAPRR